MSGVGLLQQKQHLDCNKSSTMGQNDPKGMEDLLVIGCLEVHAGWPSIWDASNGGFDLQDPLKLTEVVKSPLIYPPSSL